MRAWPAWRAGLARVWRYRGLFGLLFAMNLASGLLLALLPAAGLASLLGKRPAIQQAADGLEAELLLDLVKSGAVDAVLGSESAAPGLAGALSLTLVSLLAAGLVAPLVAWLPASFLAGGALLTFAEAPQPWRLRRFLWGCWHWLGSFLLLGLIQIVGVALVPGVLFLIGTVVAVSVGWPGYIVLAAGGLAALLWQALCELARAATVVSGGHRVGRALGAALQLVRRWALQVFLFLLLSFGTLAVVQALYGWAIAPHLPLEWWPLVLAVQQVVLALRLGLRLARWAGEVLLIEPRAAVAEAAAATPAVGDRQ